MKKKTLPLIVWIAACVAVGSTISILAGCQNGRRYPNRRHSATSVTSVTLYHIPVFYSVGSIDADLYGSGSVSDTGAIEQALESIEELTRVELNLVALKSWEVPDPPGKTYDVLLDEDELRERLPGVLSGNPYDKNPDRCDVVFFGYGRGRLHFVDYLEAEYFIPVENLLKEYAPNLWSSYPLSYWDAQRVYGEIWGIPATGAQPERLMPPFWIIREDLLSDQEISVPSSFASLIDVACELKTSDVASEPIIMAGRFDLLDYLLSINGHRSLVSNLIFFEEGANTVSSILDEPYFQVLKDAIDINEKTRIAGIRLERSASRSITRHEPDPYSRNAATPNWFAMYFDFSKTATDVYRTIALLTRYHPEFSFNVLYFEPDNEPYFIDLSSPYRYTYFIPAHTDKAVEIVKMFDVMNTRAGYNALNTVDGQKVSGSDELLLYEPDSEYPGSSTTNPIPAVASLCANPFYIPVSKQIYTDPLRDYYRRYASHELVEYDWKSRSIYTLDWEQIYDEYYDITQHYLNDMRAYFGGESKDLSWFDTITELEPRISSLKKLIQAQIDNSSFGSN